ncbi:MAG: LON peptidase substrate-binding domain-containing protein [Chloroflexi bacterium]|nr:LON peptidase substrate-binding domain-containing protein [Chloroflexota bacterium]
MELPLFPLNAVLFPGATLPLHIFEERYKQMIGRCLEERSPFGVLLIRKGNEMGEPAEPFAVGTTAHIARVQRLDEGRLNLICLGGRRFRVRKVVSEAPYLVGEVETLASDRDANPETEDLADTAAALFAEYYRLYLALANQWARTMGMPRDPDELADFIASRLSVSLWTKQQLLEELSARQRLETEIDILGDAIRELTPRVEAARLNRWRGFGAMN